MTPSVATQFAVKRTQENSSALAIMEKMAGKADREGTFLGEQDKFMVEEDHPTLSSSVSKCSYVLPK